jgi:hypothetical protein
MKVFKRIFDDWITRAAGVVLILIIALVIFNVYSHLPEEYPLFGIINFGMVPVLFVVGGVIFVLAIFKVLRSGGNGEE